MCLDKGSLAGIATHIFSDLVLPSLARPSLAAAVAVLAFFSTCFLALHQVRRRMKGVNDLYLRLVGPLLRPHELNGLPGAFWFLVGAATAIALFRRNIALQR